MPEKDNTGMGERIQSMVEDAVASMDFEQLNRNITGSIQSVFEELNIQMPQGTGQKGSRASNVRYHYGTEKTGKRAVTRYVKNPPGTVTGPVCTALGGVFTGIFGLASIVMFAVQSAVPSAGLAMAGHITLSVTIPLTIVSAVVMAKGIMRILCRAIMALMTVICFMTTKTKPNSLFQNFLKPRALLMTISSPRALI